MFCFIHSNLEFGGSGHVAVDKKIAYSKIWSNFLVSSRNLLVNCNVSQWLEHTQNQFWINLRSELAQLLLDTKASPWKEDANWMHIRCSENNLEKQQSVMSVQFTSCDQGAIWGHIYCPLPNKGNHYSGQEIQKQIT